VEEGAADGKIKNSSVVSTDKTTHLPDWTPISIVLAPPERQDIPCDGGGGITVGWRQDNGNRSNQKSKFDFLATRKCLVKIDEEQQKIKIVRTNR